MLEPPDVQSPLDLSSEGQIIQNAYQASDTGFILGLIGVAALVAFFLIVLFYDGAEALFHRPPARVVRISILVGALSFFSIYAGTHASPLVSITVSAALALCSLGLWWRHRKRQIRRARGIPPTWQVESERVQRDLGHVVNQNAGHLKKWWARL